ncbi:hypothetical protein V7968_02580 [Nocardia vulneris]
MFEFVEQRHHVAQVAGEPVDPIDEQYIDYAIAGGLEGSLQAVAFGGGAGGIVGES